MKSAKHENKNNPASSERMAKLAESCWFVSSFVMSLIMGPFSALPALLALFSLRCEATYPNSIH